MAQKINGTDLLETYEYHRAETIKLAAGEQDSDVAIQSIQTKSYHVKKMAELCEQMGVPNEKISGKLTTDLEGYVSDRMIRYVCADLGYTDQDKNNSKQGAEAIAAEFTSIGFELENTQMIDLCDRVIAFQQNLRKKLSDNPYESVLEPKILQEHLYTLNNLIDTAEECLDERETAVEVSHHMLFCEIMKEGTAHAAETFQTKVKTLKLTPKQTTNYRLGQVRRLHALYDPHDEEDAITSPSKFYGIKCAYQHCQKCEHNNKLSAMVCTWCNSTEVVKQGCGSWRVKIGNQADAIYTVHCFACQADFKPTTKPLPRTNNEMTVNVIMQSPSNATATVNADLGS